MKSVAIYTSSSCPYCIMAKELLESKGIEFQELRVDINSAYAAEAVQKSGGKRTVPQIFIGDYHVGGYDDLCALDQAGKLDTMVKS